MCLQRSDTVCPLATVIAYPKKKWWSYERMHPKGPLGKTHHGKDHCSTAFACPWKRIQVCQVTCTRDPSEVTPLTNGVKMGREKRLLGFWVTHNSDPITIPSLPSGTRHPSSRGTPSLGGGEL